MKPDRPHQTDPRQDYKLWLWVAAAFFVLIGAWAFLIVTAQQHQPEVIQIERP